MSGIGPSELIILVVIGLLILGPERLPRVASQIGRWVGKARRTANQLRYQLEREVALADIDKNKNNKKKDPKARPHDDSAPPAGPAEAAGASSDSAASGAAASGAAASGSADGAAKESAPAADDDKKPG